MADAHKNFAISLVATAPSPATSGTSLVVTAADGAKFPAAPFNATIWPAGVQPTTANSEIVRVTAVSTDTFTIVRQQEGTSARTVIIGDQIDANITAKTLTDVEKLLTGVTGGSLSASTDYVAVDKLEISATDTLELPATSTLEIEPILRNPDLRNDRFYNPYKFSVYRSAATTSSSAYAVIPMDTKVFDTSSNVDVVTNKGRFTAPIDGFYWFGACCGNTAATATAMGTAFWKNGALIKNGVQADPSAVAGGGNLFTASGILQLIAGDYVEAVFIGGAGSVILVGQTACFFEGFLVSAI